MQKPTAVHKAVIRRCEQDAQYGNATHMNEFVKSLREKFGATEVKTAVHDLAKARVAPVHTIALNHVGHGFYELCEVKAHELPEQYPTTETGWR